MKLKGVRDYFGARWELQCDVTGGSGVELDSVGPIFDYCSVDRCDDFSCLLQGSYQPDRSVKSFSTSNALE